MMQMVKNWTLLSGLNMFVLSLVLSHFPFCADCLLVVLCLSGGRLCVHFLCVTWFFAIATSVNCILFVRVAQLKTLQQANIALAQLVAPAGALV